MTSLKPPRLAIALLIWLALRAQDGRCTLVGSVVDPTGAPLASADILLVRSGFGERHSGVTDSGGKFEIRDLPPGEYGIAITLNGFLKKTIDKLQITSGEPVDMGVLQLAFATCNSPGGPICDSFEAAVAADIPILTVCEVLRDAGRYDGKTVVVVGSFGKTMEGSWLTEECAPKVVVNGRPWTRLS